MSFILPATSAAIRQAVERLSSGELVAFPTETVYGLGADATNPSAVEKIYQIKGRPSWHPLIVHLASSDDLKTWANEIPPGAQLLADEFWPGALTIVLPRHPSVFDVVTGGLNTVALRVPSHPVALELLKEFGGAIAAPSANKFGRVSPTAARHVHDEFDEELLILDGGSSEIGLESTIVAVDDDGLVLLRPGAIGIEDLERISGLPVLIDEGNTPAPGNLPSHYSPNARVSVVELINYEEFTQRLTGSNLCAFGEIELPEIKNVVQLAPTGYGDVAFAHNFYDRLRDADRLNAGEVIVVMPTPTSPPLHQAITDRLLKASQMSEIPQH